MAKTVLLNKKAAFTFTFLATDVVLAYVCFHAGKINGIDLGKDLQNADDLKDLYDIANNVSKIPTELVSKDTNVTNILKEYAIFKPESVDECGPVKVNVTTIQFSDQNSSDMYPSLVVKHECVPVSVRKKEILQSIKSYINQAEESIPIAKNISQQEECHEDLEKLCLLEKGYPSRFKDAVAYLLFSNLCDENKPSNTSYPSYCTENGLGDDASGSKIHCRLPCTDLNQAYGFGSYRVSGW